MNILIYILRARRVTKSFSQIMGRGGLINDRRCILKVSTETQFDRSKRGYNSNDLVSLNHLFYIDVNSFRKQFIERIISTLFPIILIFLITDQLIKIGLLKYT